MGEVGAPSPQVALSGLGQSSMAADTAAPSAWPASQIFDFYKQQQQAQQQQQHLHQQSAQPTQPQDNQPQGQQYLSNAMAAPHPYAAFWPNQVGPLISEEPFLLCSACRAWLLFGAAESAVQPRGCRPLCMARLSHMEAFSLIRNFRLQVPVRHPKCTGPGLSSSQAAVQQTLWTALVPLPLYRQACEVTADTLVPVACQITLLIKQSTPASVYLAGRSAIGRECPSRRLHL